MLSLSIAKNKTKKFFFAFVYNLSCNLIKKRLKSSLQIREEDKDPVYKYLESMMTCARVREFNSKPPPQVTIEPKIFAPNAPTKPQKTTDKYYSTLPTVNKAGKKNSCTVVKWDIKGVCSCLKTYFPVTSR